MTERARALGRVVAQQRTMRDRALGLLAVLKQRERGLAERERALAERRGGDDALAHLLLPMVARRLQTLAAERAHLAAAVAQTEEAARKHAGFARAGEIGVRRLQAASAARDERASLEEIGGRAAGQPGASRLL